MLENVCNGYIVVSLNFVLQHARSLDQETRRLSRGHRNCGTVGPGLKQRHDPHLSLLGLVLNAREGVEAANQLVQNVFIESK
jgi:hypothetical protein